MVAPMVGDMSSSRSTVSSPLCVVHLQAIVFDGSLTQGWQVKRQRNYHTDGDVGWSLETVDSFQLLGRLLKGKTE